MTYLQSDKNLVDGTKPLSMVEDKRTEDQLINSSLPLVEVCLMDLLSTVTVNFRYGSGVHKYKTLNRQALALIPTSTEALTRYTFHSRCVSDR